MDDNHSLRTPVLGVHPHFGFKPLHTIWIIFCLIFFLLTVEFITLAYVFVFTNDSNMRCDLYFLIIYAEVSIWALFFIVRFYINLKHKLNLMAKGYFQFYEVSSRYIEIPFYISSIWLCVLLIITCLYVQDTPSREFFCNTNFYYSPIVVVTTALSTQNVLLVPLFAMYIMKVYEFNKRQPPPDSESGNQWMPNYLRDTMASDETGYRERYEVPEGMLEKQADLLRYYKNTIEVLNKQIFKLTSQGRSAVDVSYGGET